MKKKLGPGESFRKLGPGESFRKLGPGEQRVPNGDPSGPTDMDTEGHGITDIITRPVDEVTGQPRTGHDGLVNHPRTGGE